MPTNFLTLLAPATTPPFLCSHLQSSLQMSNLYSLSANPPFFSLSHPRQAFVPTTPQKLLLDFAFTFLSLVVCFSFSSYLIIGCVWCSWSLYPPSVLPLLDSKTSPSLHLHPTSLVNFSWTSLLVFPPLANFLMLKCSDRTHTWS